MKLYSYLILIVIYLIISIFEKFNHISCVNLNNIQKNYKENDEKSSENSNSEIQDEKQIEDKIDSNIVSERDEEVSEKIPDSNEDLVKEKKTDNQEELDIERKDIIKEDERKELKKLEEFKRNEIMEKNDEPVLIESSDKPEIDEKKYQVESEIITKNELISEIKVTGENEFTITRPIVNQVINKIIQPITDDKQLQIEMKEDPDQESDNEDNKRMKAVILTFDLSNNTISNKISLITNSKLTITRYIGMAPQKIKITIVDPTLQINHSQTRMSELSKYDSIEYNIKQKIPGKADTIPLNDIATQIPTILQQYNTTMFRLLLESANTQSQFGILSNMDGVGPTLVIELKPTIESNSTWMYTITGAAIIFVIIGVSIALYFQNKNKESQKVEHMPLLNNKV